MDLAFKVKAWDAAFAPGGDLESLASEMKFANGRVQEYEKTRTQPATPAGAA